MGQTHTYLERYVQGEREQVWEELFALGDGIQEEGLFNDALAVTKETLNRANHNIDLLISRLKAIGYTFGVYPDGHHKLDRYKLAHNFPPKNIREKIARSEALEGINSFPLSLKVFWEIIGDVDFTGYFPAWPRYADPIIIYPIESIKADYPEWQYQVNQGDVEAGYFGVPISPDYYHKDNVSGGEPYRLRVPNRAIDGILEYERHETTFINYLCICFKYGGFLGLGLQREPLPEAIHYLTKGLVPI